MGRKHFLSKHCYPPTLESVVLHWSMDPSLDRFTYRQNFACISTHTNPLRPMEQEKLSTVILTDQPWFVKCLSTFVLKCPEFIHIPFGDNILHFHWGIFLPHSNLRETVNQGARLMANGWAHDLSQGS